MSESATSRLAGRSIVSVVINHYPRDSGIGNHVRRPGRFYVWRSTEQSANQISQLINESINSSINRLPRDSGPLCCRFDHQTVNQSSNQYAVERCGGTTVCGDGMARRGSRDEDPYRCRRLYCDPNSGMGMSASILHPKFPTNERAKRQYRIGIYDVTYIYIYGHWVRVSLVLSDLLSGDIYLGRFVVSQSD